MVDDFEPIRDLAELPPPIKPHPLSDPLSAKRPEANQETVRSQCASRAPLRTVPLYLGCNLSLTRMDAAM